MNSAVKKLPYTLIAYDHGTQQRMICEETVENYTALMKENVVFPPLEVVFDGRMYYLWDGFHRFFAGQAAGIKTFACNVTRGTARDAVWLSFSANKAHGKPRDREVVREIIKRILDDEEWINKSHTEIAAHVGVSRRRVSQLIVEISRQKGSDVGNISHTGNSDSTNTDVGNISHTGNSDSTNTDVGNISHTGNTDSTIQETTETQTGTPAQKGVDFTPQKRPVPERLRPVFENRSKTYGYITRLKKLQEDIEKDMTEDPLYWHFFVKGSLDTDIKNLTRQLKAAMPYAVCRFCGGTAPENCLACKSSGFMNELRFNTVPEEIR